MLEYLLHFSCNFPTGSMASNSTLIRPQHFNQTKSIVNEKATIHAVWPPQIVAFGGYYLPFVGGFIGAVATATSDTLGSEIGVLSTPRIITTFKKVPPGTDGAVSILGTSAGILGSAIIGFVAFLLGVLNDPWLALKISVISGTIGCFMDSFLGAVFERRNYLNNEHVNLLATITGAIVGILCTL